MLTTGSLFSGIGGLELGIERAGLGPVMWQVERDPFCMSVLKRHWPHVARYEDVKEVGAANLAPVDLICGGFPCQDISSAGKGAGLAGGRSGLWFEFARIVSELRPEWVVVENVASGAKRWVNQVVAGLGQLDYQALPVPLSAEDVGAPYPRARIFIVAHTDRNRKSSQPVNAEVARPPKLDSVASREREVAGAVGNLLWQQPRWICGASREGAPLLATHSYASGFGRIGRGRQLQARQPEAEKYNWWGTPPPVDAVVPRLPGRVDHQRALGNAVVPQCAEVIGWVIRELLISPAPASSAE